VTPFYALLLFVFYLQNTFWGFRVLQLASPQDQNESLEDEVEDLKRGLNAIGRDSFENDLHQMEIFHKIVVDCSQLDIFLCRWRDRGWLIQRRSQVTWRMVWWWIL